MALTAADLQLILRHTYGVAGKVLCVAPTGNDSTGDGLTWDTAFLTLHPLRTGGASAAGANDLILIAQGTVAATLASVSTFTAGVRIKGQGVDVTTLTVALSGIELAGLTIEDLTVSLSSVGGLLVTRDGTGVLRRVKTVGVSDGIFAFPPASISLRCDDCDFTSAFDACVIDSGAVKIDFIRCRFLTLVPSGTHNLARTLVVDAAVTGRVRLFNCDLNAINLDAGQNARGILNAGACAIEVHQGGVYSTVVAGGGTAYDLENTGSGSIFADGSDVKTTSGSNISVIPKSSRMVDATAAGLAKFVTGDTGQTTAAAGSVAKLAGAAAPTPRTITVNEHSTVSGG